MKILEVLLNQQIIQLIGWALLHSLWQGIIIVAFLKIAMIFLRKASANARYILAYVSLVLILMLPLFTGWITYRSTLNSFSASSANQAGNLFETDGKVIDTSEQIQIFQTNKPLHSWTDNLYRIENLLPWLVMIWFSGVFICSLRLFGAWSYTQRLRKRETQSELEMWQVKLKYPCSQLGIKKAILLLESSLVKVPTVVGWLKPIILLPPSALTGLTPQQLELILVHELAHIRRNDYLANLFQTVIETLLFYHPAAWWVSRRIRVERENACDDIAVTINGDAVMYARALTKMERLRKTAPQLAIAADGGSLVNRIHRLLGIEKTHSLENNGIWTSIFTVIFLIAVGVGAQISSFDNSISTNAAEQKIQDNNSNKIDDLKSRNPFEQAAAICALGKKGDVSAIPFLIQFLGDETNLSKPVGCWDSGDWSPLLNTFKQLSLGEEAAIALASLGEPAVEPLVAALTDSNPGVRRNAAWAIGEIRDGDKINRSVALEPLIFALKDEDAWVRRAAAFALSEIKDKRATMALISALSDENAGVREMAANALGEMKEPNALEALESVLKDKDEQVRAMAKWAIAEIRDR